MSLVQDQNPACQHRGDPVLQHDLAAHNAPKKRDLEKRPSVFQNPSIDISPPSEVCTEAPPATQPEPPTSDADVPPNEDTTGQKKKTRGKKSRGKKSTKTCIPYTLWKNKPPPMATPRLQPGPVKVKFIDAWGKPIAQKPTLSPVQENTEQGTAKITIKIPGLPNKIITVPPKVKEVPACQKYPTLASRLACLPPMVAPHMIVSMTAEEMETSIASQETVETTCSSTTVSLFRTARKKLRAKFVQAHHKFRVAKSVHNIISQRKKLRQLYRKNYSIWKAQKEILLASSPLLHLCPHANLPPEDMSDSELSHTTVVSSPYILETEDISFEEPDTPDTIITVGTVDGEPIHDVHLKVVIDSPTPKKALQPTSVDSALDAQAEAEISQLMTALNLKQDTIVQWGDVPFTYSVPVSILLSVLQDHEDKKLPDDTPVPASPALDMNSPSTPTSSTSSMFLQIPFDLFHSLQEVNFVNHYSLRYGSIQEKPTLEVGIQNMFFYFQVDTTDHSLVVPVVVRNGHLYTLRDKDLSYVLKLGQAFASYIKF